MSKALDFGVQSWCFRETKTNEGVAKKAREIGVDKVELCAVHADFSKPSAFKEVVSTYKNEGVSIISLGVETLVGDPNERTKFECAQMAGAKHISVHFQVGTFPKAVEQAQKFSDEYGVRLGVHCHGGYMFGGQPDVMEHLINLGSPQVGLCIDTAWCMQIGPHRGKPVEWVQKWAKNLYGIHYKDFTFGRNGQWTDVVVGEGNLDLPAFLKALDEAKFDGMAVIEYEADPANPVPALTNCVKAMRSAGKA